MHENTFALQAVKTGKTFLGIEFGSTRIKAVLTDTQHRPLASGSYDWENRFEDGIWTYSLESIHAGLQSCYRSLCQNVEKQYGIVPETIGAVGVSAMMHGYMVFDAQGELLVPFRTWRNTITGQASKALSERFSFNIPERWSIAHLYQAILNQEPHVSKIAYMTTLAGYIHWRLTGQKVLGVGDASGMFPVDQNTGRYDAGMLAVFDHMIQDKAYPWQLSQILPAVLLAGENAGVLTAEGAALLDVSGSLRGGIPFCPSEGDAGTGMTATNSITVNTGNVSAGTSVFAMAVLEKNLPDFYPEIDMVTTPAGAPVAMVHCNNCSGDLDGWLRLFAQVLAAFNAEPQKSKLYTVLLNQALRADADCGGLMSYNYLSGESITGLSAGNPVFIRAQNSTFDLPNFMKTQLLSALCTLRIGMDILYSNGVCLDAVTGHGGYFKERGVGANYMAAALGTPVRVMETAGEGGPWGMALLAAYSAQKTNGQSLEAYLRDVVFAGAKAETVLPAAEEVDAFNRFLARYKSAFAVEKAAAEFSFEAVAE